MKRLPALLITAARAVSGVVVCAPAARASDYCDYEDTSAPSVSGMTPTRTVLGTTPEVVTFEPYADDECGMASWSITGDDYNFFVYDGAPNEAFDPYDNSEAGLGYATVDVYDQAYNETVEVVRYRLLRKAAFRAGSFSARPEPVRKSGTIIVKGTLARADWGCDSYRNHGEQPVEIQFKAKGKSSFTTVTTVRTTSAGTFSKKLSSRRGDGTWRAVFAGDGVTSDVTRGTDYVDVR